jgi:hypothetical protein
MGPQPATSGIVMQPFQAERPVTLSPLADCHASGALLLGDGRVGFAGTPGQHDFGALHDRLLQRSGVRTSLELLNLVIALNQQWHWTTKCHETPRQTPFILDTLFGTA